MLKIIDARSGRENIRAGDVVTYPDGEWWSIERVVDRFFTATAYVHDHTTGSGGAAKPVPLGVRFTHPSFFLQRVAFFPS